MKKIISTILILMQSSAFAQSPATIPNNKLVIGKTGSADKTIEFNLTKAGATANPKIKYDNSTSKLKFSNDGSNFLEIGSGGSADNKLTNGNFESSTNNWTASGGTFTTTTTAANVFEGTAAGSWDSSSASQTLTGTAITVGGLAGTNAELTCMIQVPSGTATHTLGVWDGTTLSSAQTISNGSSTSYVATTINFIVPSSGTITPRLTSVAADEPSIYPDDCYVGKARNIGTVSQATIVGTLTYAGGTSRQWVIAQSTYAADFSADTDFAAPTVLGSVIAPGTKVPQVLFNAGVGRYKATYIGAIGRSSADNVFCRLVDDLGNVYVETMIINATPSGNSNTAPGLSGVVDYTTTGQRTVKLQCRTSAGGNAFTSTDVTGSDAKFIIEYFPSSSQQAVSSANADYDWISFTPTGTFTTNSTYTGKYRRVGEMMEVQTRIAFAGAPNSIGLTLNLPSGFTVDSSKILNPITNGTPLISNGEALDAAVTEVPVFAYYNNTTSVYVNAIGSASSYANTNQVTQAVPFSFGSGDHLEITYHVPISGWSTNQRAPTLVGSVTSNSAGALRIESLGFGGNSSYSACTTGSCTIINPSTSGWATVSFSSTGVYTVNYSGAFSAPPICTATSNVASTSAAYLNVSSVPTTSSFTLNSYNGVTPLNGAGTIVCVGPR